jgi:uncharacterized protein (TIGR00106 family)
MAMMEITVLPVGTPTPSLSKYVAGAVKLLQNEKDIKFEVTAMGTVVEGETERLLKLASKMHRSAFTGGIQRVVTTVKIDERLDKPLTIEGKVRAVKEKLV